MCVCVCVCLNLSTSVVNISRDLYVTQLCVDRQFIEVFVLLQSKVSPQCRRVPIAIHRVDQHGVKVIKLDRGVKDKAPKDHFIVKD